MENLVASLMRLLLHIMVTKLLHGYLLSLFYHYYTMFTLYEDSNFSLLLHHHNGYLLTCERVGFCYGKKDIRFPGFKLGF